MDNYETGIYTDNPDDTLRYMQTTQPVDLWGYPKQEQDLVEVVRCKDCKHWYNDADTGMACEFTNLGQPMDGFCNLGERRSEWTGMRREKKNSDIKDAEIAYIRLNR